MRRSRTLATGSTLACSVVATALAATLTTTPAHAELQRGASVVASIPVDDAGGMPDVGFGSVWVVNGGGTVSRIDPTTNAVVADIEVGAGAFGVRTGDGAVWVTNLQDGTLTRIDPATDTVAAVIAVGTLPIGLAVTPGAVWVANHWASGPDPTGSVMRIDPATDSVVDTIPVGNAPTNGPKFMTAAAGSIWVGVPNLHAVVRISMTTDEVEATIPDKGTCSGLVATNDAVWVAGGGGPDCAPGVTRIDTGTNQNSVKVTAGGNVSDVAAGAGSVWFVAYHSTFVGRISIATGAVTSLLDVGRAPSGVTFGFGSAWVLDPAHARVLRLQPA